MRAFVLCATLIAGLSAVAPARGVTERLALIDALRDADATEAARLIEAGAPLNERDESGATALMWAVQRLDAGLTERLLKAGADPNLSNALGLSPLQIALDLRAGDLAVRLIEAGAKVNAARTSGETVLMTAARAGQLSAMAALIARGADVNARERQFHQTALMWSIGHPEQVRLLLAHGAKFQAATRTWNITNTVYTDQTYDTGPWTSVGEFSGRKGGLTALHFAALADDIESIALLLEAGADIDAPAADGSTALLLSLYKWKDGGGKSSGPQCGENNYYVAEYTPNLRVAKLLLDRGASAKSSDSAGYTPLYGLALGFMPVDKMRKCFTPEAAASPAALKGQFADAISLVTRLLDLGADPNASTRFPTPGPIGAVRINPEAVGSTPLHVAADSGNLDLVRVLLERGADPNRVRSDGLSPLAVATKTNQLPTVRLLVESGGDVKHLYDPADLILDEFIPGATQLGYPRKRQSLLHIAAAAGAQNVVAYIVAQGCALDLTNSRGETALQLAVAQERVRYQTKKAAVALDRAAKDSEADSTIKLDSLTSDAIRGLMLRQANQKDTPTCIAGCTAR